MKKSFLIRHIVVFLVLLLSAGILVREHLTYKRVILDKAREEAVLLTHNATVEIDAILQNVVSAAEGIAHDLGTGKLNKGNLLAALEEFAGREEFFFGVAVAYEPYAFAADKKLYAPYYVKKNGQLQLVQIESIYDYTLPEHDWYARAIKEGSMWLEPFFGKASDMLLTVYSVPFYKTQSPAGERGSPLGVVTVTLSVDYIKKIIQNLDLGHNGFAALTSKKGVYLYHPNNEYVIAQETIFDVAKEKNDKDWILVGNKALQGEGGLLKHKSTTGLLSWLVFEPIPATGWSLQNTFVNDDVFVDIDIPRRQLIWITVVVILTLFSAFAFITAVAGWNRKQFWFLAIVFSSLLTVGIGFIWHLTLKYHKLQNGNSVVINDRTTLQNAMRRFDNLSEQRHTQKPTYIPTGIYIESLRFADGKDLSVSGFAWQKYAIGAHDHLGRGFMISGADSFELTEVMRARQNNTEIVRWSFKAEVLQNMHSAQYPLEQETIGLKLMHQDLVENVVLVPDLVGYKILSPSSLPGLETGLSLPGWKMLRSFYMLTSKSRNTNFGLEDANSQGEFPALSYNITIRRNFIDSFVSSMTPLIVAAFLLFVILMLTTQDEKLVKAGTGTARTINMCAALFFVVIFAHIDIRKSISPDEIFYLEYFYIVMYIALLWISLNSVIFATARDTSLIRYQDNLLAKLCYWPLITLTLFVITIFQFY